jgi:hypothetical protein
MTHSYNTRFQAQAKQAKQKQQAQQVNPFHVRHQHATRFEYRRVRELVAQRDYDVIRYLLRMAEVSTGILDRLNILTSVFTYLQRHLILFRVKPFKDGMWNKMNELEKQCHVWIEYINSMEEYKKFQKHLIIRDQAQKLVDTMNEVRNNLRTFVGAF